MQVKRRKGEEAEQAEEEERALSIIANLFQVGDHPCALLFGALKDSTQQS